MTWWTRNDYDEPDLSSEEENNDDDEEEKPGQVFHMENITQGSTYIKLSLNICIFGCQLRKQFWVQAKVSMHWNVNRRRSYICFSMAGITAIIAIVLVNIVWNM